MQISVAAKRLISFLLLITFGTLVYAFAPEPRADQMCGYMPNEAKIYCYGGHRFGVNGSVTSSFEQYFFSMNLAQDWEVANMLKGWELITQDLGPNVNFAMEIVPNENLIFMHGGAISTIIQTRYKAAYFKTTDAAAGWKQVIPQQTGSRVTTQSAILGPDNSTIYIWGGMRNDYTGEMEPGDEKFPLTMYTLNVKNWQWGTGGSAAAPLTFAKAVLVGSSIYYIGGYTILSDIVRANKMDSVLMYNTDSGGWQTQSIGGSVTPSTRMRHTATLKPSTGEIILFGGVDPGNEGQTRDDYFYILSTQNGNLTWSTRELGGHLDALGIVGHSAVLAEDYLFIMFGAINWDNKTSTYILSNDVRALDVNTWTWLTSISAFTPEAGPPTTDTDTDTERNDVSIGSSVSTGTIAGAVVGGVAGLAIIIGLIAFLLLRRRKNQKLEKKEHKRSSAMMLPEKISQIDSPTAYEISDSSIVQGKPPVFYSSEKPDGSYMKISVKPDGG